MYNSPPSQWDTPSLPPPRDVIFHVASNKKYRSFLLRSIMNDFLFFLEEEEEEEKFYLLRTGLR